jgi:hypothetical protein
MPPSYRRSTTIAIAGLVILAALALIVWFTSRPANPLPQTYRNNTYGFSLRLPADYTVTETLNANPPAENGVADIIEFGNVHGNVQLTITYASYAATELPTQSLLSSYPSLSGIQTQPFPIAPGETGLALHKDPAHPDQVSDVWFGKNGYLYQLTTFDDGYNELLPVAHSITLF